MNNEIIGIENSDIAPKIGLFYDNSLMIPIWFRGPTLVMPIHAIVGLLN